MLLSTDLLRHPWSIANAKGFKLLKQRVSDSVEIRLEVTLLESFQVVVIRVFFLNELDSQGPFIVLYGNIKQLAFQNGSSG